MSNVKLFRSTDFGAPVLYGAVGSLIQVLDACLVNGYGEQTIFSLTHSEGTVTATTTLAHNLQPYSRQTIVGANETGYNGEFIITVIDAFTFSYSASGIIASPATGTITTKSVSAGWTKSFNGTNLAAYRQGSGRLHYLRIDDTSTTYARCVGYEIMTGISTGTGIFPTAPQVTGGLYWQKSASSDSTNARDWIIIADDKTLYMWCKYNTDTTYNSYSMHGFGEFNSYKSGDAYNTFLSANTSGSISYQYMYFMYLGTYVGAALSSSVFGFYAPRSYTQVGSSVPLVKIGDASKASQPAMGYGGLPYPHPVDGGLYMSPVGVAEGVGAASQAVLRGVMRGIWNPLHNVPLNQGDIFQGNGDLLGKTFLTLWGCGSQTSLAEAMIDISLTWE